MLKLEQPAKIQALTLVLACLSTTDQILPLSSNPLHPLHLTHKINIFRHPSLRPYASAQRHRRDLQKHFELRSEALVYPSCRGDPPEKPSRGLWRKRARKYSFVKGVVFVPAVVNLVDVVVADRRCLRM